VEAGNAEYVTSEEKDDGPSKEVQKQQADAAKEAQSQEQDKQKVIDKAKA
jgi:hypothetical protein